MDEQPIDPMIETHTRIANTDFDVGNFMIVS